MCKKICKLICEIDSPSIQIVNFALETWRSPIYVSSMLVILVNRS